MEEDYATLLAAEEEGMAVGVDVCLFPSPIPPREITRGALPGDRGPVIAHTRFGEIRVNDRNATRGEKRQKELAAIIAKETSTGPCTGVTIALKGFALPCTDPKPIGKESIWSKRAYPFPTAHPPPTYNPICLPSRTAHRPPSPSTPRPPPSPSSSPPSAPQTPDPKTPPKGDKTTEDSRKEGGLDAGIATSLVHLKELAASLEALGKLDGQVATGHKRHRSALTQLEKDLISWQAKAKNVSKSNADTPNKDKEKEKAKEKEREREREKEKELCRERESEAQKEEAARKEKERIEKREAMREADRERERERQKMLAEKREEEKRVKREQAEERERERERERQEARRRPLPDKGPLPGPDPFAPNRVIMMIGSQCSGKSTFSRQMADEFGWAIVNQDECGSRTACLDMLTSILEQGESAIIDRTNFTAGHRHHFIRLATRFRVPVDGLWMDTPLDTCLKRLKVRKDHPTLHFCAEHIKILKETCHDLEPPEPKEGFRFNFRVRSETEGADLMRVLCLSVADQEDGLDESPKKLNPSAQPYSYSPVKEQHSSGKKKHKNRGKRK